MDRCHVARLQGAKGYFIAARGRGGLQSRSKMTFHVIDLRLSKGDTLERMCVPTATIGRFFPYASSPPVSVLVFKPVWLVRICTRPYVGWKGGTRLASLCPWR